MRGDKNSVLRRPTMPRDAYQAREPSAWSGSFRQISAITIRRIRIGETDLYKRVRLASLREAPYAFTSAYETALSRSDESWREQADGTASGDDRATFIVFSGDAPVGIAALYRMADRADAGEVIQVWLDPGYRGKRVARDLMDAVFEWAAGNRFREIIAKITIGNTRALRFYYKYGFAPVSDATPEESGCVVLQRDIGL
jgi:RimJ/RimL family protein N-acetyltransferase